jgi:hypothetical protein
MKLSRKISLSLVILSCILILFAGISLIADYLQFWFEAMMLSLLSLPLSTGSIFIEQKYSKDERTATIILFSVILIVTGVLIFGGLFNSLVISYN